MVLHEVSAGLRRRGTVRPVHTAASARPSGGNRQYNTSIVPVWRSCVIPLQGRWRCTAATQHVSNIATLNDRAFLQKQCAAAPTGRHAPPQPTGRFIHTLPQRTQSPNGPLTLERLLLATPPKDDRSAPLETPRPPAHHPNLTLCRTTPVVPGTIKKRSACSAQSQAGGGGRR